MVDIRKDLTAHILRLPLDFLNFQNPGYLLSRVDSDVGNLAGMMTDKYIQAIFDLITFVAALAIMFHLNGRLAWLVVAVLPFFLVSIQYFSSRTRTLSGDLQESYGKLASVLQEIFGNAYLIKLFNTQKKELSSFVAVHRQSVAINLRMIRLNLVSTLVMGCIATLSPLVVIWFGGIQVVQERMTIGSLFAFNMYLAYLFNPLRNIYSSILSFEGSRASFERIREMTLKAPQEAYASKPADPGDIHHGGLRIRNLSFTYPGADAPVLDGLDLDIDANRKTAIVGPSGIGKTTLFNLILKMYEGYEGETSIDGVPLADYGLDTLRRRVKLVPQDPFLLNRSVFENISYGSPGASEAEVWAAAELALAHDFIRRLPQGYETIIGERGMALSGGERQRIALARALVGNPRILLLDEATAFLDSRTESLVQEAIQNSMIGRTCIVVAHRLNTVLNAEKICLLGERRLVASCPHELLYSQCPSYRTLVNLQFLA